MSGENWMKLGQTTEKLHRFSIFGAWITISGDSFNLIHEKGQKLVFVENCPIFFWPLYFLFLNGILTFLAVIIGNFDCFQKITEYHF